VSESLQEIINKVWITPERAEWTPKADVVACSDVQRWMASTDIEILGFTYALLSDRRIRIEPSVPLDDYVRFVKLYYERCFRENPDGEWSDSSHSAGMGFVNLFAHLWRDMSVPRSVLDDLKVWLGRLYKEGDPDIRICIVQATLEHLFEQEQLREFFSDWKDDKILAVAHEEASEWYKGGGRSPLGKPHRSDW
jgi:hypothetical protein